MRFIYLDEAGTSKAEPVRVMAAIIVRPDSDWRRTEALIKEAFDKHVPDKIRGGFVFHAKEIFSGGGNIKREEWSRLDRMCFLEEFLTIPRRAKLSISHSHVMSGYVSGDLMKPGSPLSPHEFEHMLAFALCIQAADFHLRKHCAADEVATAIAEDNPSMRRFLKFVFPIVNEQFLRSMVECANYESDIEPGVQRIVDCVHFADKSGALMLQLADACAFAYRRWLSGQEHGGQLVTAMCGRAPDVSDLDRPIAFGTDYWAP